MGVTGFQLYSPVPFVYILRCRDGSLYTGATKDLDRRVAQHRAGTASRYTRSRLPVALAFSRRVRTWGDALRLEARLKRMPRAEKLAIVRASRTASSRAASPPDRLPSP
ncbi:MAG: GIY-YIG nuclease family protein [Acidobacteria bacterium]|nr:GIY-YIG nuclease family protein [Acidobacteriota bacterium]